MIGLQKISIELKATYGKEEQLNTQCSENRVEISLNVWSVHLRRCYKTGQAFEVNALRTDQIRGEVSH